MITRSFLLFLLRPLRFDAIHFPRWQAIVAVTLLGFLAGLAPSWRTTQPDVPVIPTWLPVSMMCLSVWAIFLVTVVVLHWWLQRGGRWDGHGDLFNLIAAAGFISHGIVLMLSLMETSIILLLPLWGYSIWVIGHALSGAIPKASLSYSFMGVAVSVLFASLVSGILFGVFAISVDLLGVVPVESFAHISAMNTK